MFLLRAAHAVCLPVDAPCPSQLGLPVVLASVPGEKTLTRVPTPRGLLSWQPWPLAFGRLIPETVLCWGPCQIPP